MLTVFAVVNKVINSFFCTVFSSAFFCVNFLADRCCFNFIIAILPVKMDVQIDYSL